MNVWLETPSIVPLAPTDTPSMLDNWADEIPSPVPGFLPCILIEVPGESPVVIFFSDHAHEYFIWVNDTLLTYALVKKSEEELVKPELHMSLEIQDIWEKMQMY